MSLFYKLEDVYFDTMHLAEALEAIPPECECQDGEAHLAGECCCAAPLAVVGEAANPPRKGCLVHLQNLSESLPLLNEDVERERRRFEPAEMPPEVHQRVFRVELLVGRLNAMADLLKERLKQFQVTCAHGDLQRIKEGGAEVRKLVGQLNELL